MRAKTLAKLTLLLLYVLILSSIHTVKSLPVAAFEKNPAVPDVTSKVEMLGNPFSKPAYARNVWDMQLFDGKIYLGHGNSSNGGPSTNPGPIPVYYYDPVHHGFSTQDVVSAAPASSQSSTRKYVDEEQIDTFKVLNGKLYIPGHDAREGWENGNYYILDGNKWIKYRNIPNAIHVYDMDYYNGKLYAAVGTNTSPDVLVSTDNGMTWEKIGSVSDSPEKRVYTLLEFQNKLYAFSVMWPKMPSLPPGFNVLAISDSGGKSPGKLEAVQKILSDGQLVPEVKYTNQVLSKMVRTTVVNGRFLYIVGELYNDHQWLSKALMVATDIHHARRLVFPNPDEMPMDILARGNTVYVLSYFTDSSGQVTNLVYKTDDLVHWRELFRFRQDTFARSFEELDGDFYFGLGCNTDVIPDSTGSIMKVARTAYSGR